LYDLCQTSLASLLKVLLALVELEHGLEREQLGTVPWHFVGWHFPVGAAAAWQPRRASGCWKHHPSWHSRQTVADSNSHKKTGNNTEVAELEPITQQLTQN